MIAANARRRRGEGRGRKGLWALALVGIAMAAMMGLMMASADQTPYGATQVWSAEPTGAITSNGSIILGSRTIASNTYGQDMGSLPAATLIQVGAQ